MVTTRLRMWWLMVGLVIGFALGTVAGTYLLMWTIWQFDLTPTEIPIEAPLHRRDYVCIEYPVEPPDYLVEIG